jgi:hypothetical protein
MRQISFFFLITFFGTLDPVFRKVLPEHIFQAVMLAGAIGIIVLLVKLFTSKHQDDTDIPYLTYANAVGALFSVITLGLLIAQNVMGKKFGYHLSYPAVIYFYAILTVCFLVFTSGKAGSHWLLIKIVIAYFTGQIFCLGYFPLGSERSDMFALMTAGIERLLGGQNPYVFFKLPFSGDEFHYLPGLFCWYIPCVKMNIDPRIVNIAANIIAMHVLFFCSKNRNRDILLIAIFFLNPWLQYRHDTYLGPFILMLSLFIAARVNNKRFLESIFFGVCCCMYPFAWLLIPLYVKVNFKFCYMPVIVVALVFMPFIEADAPVFFRFAILHKWAELTLPTWNLSYYANSLIGAHGLKILQYGSTMVILSAGFLMTKTYRQFFLWGTLGVTAFILLNVLIWNYFFIIISFLSMSYILFNNVEKVKYS